jgi:hypothetical protein
MLLLRVPLRYNACSVFLDHLKPFESYLLVERTALSRTQSARSWQFGVLTNSSASSPLCIQMFSEGFIVKSIAVE